MIELSTQLSRAKRSKSCIPIFAVGNFEMATAVCEALKDCKRIGGILIDDKHFTHRFTHIVAAAVVELSRDYNNVVTLYRTDPDHESLLKAYKTGAQGLLIREGVTSKKEMISETSWAHHLVKDTEVSVIGNISGIPDATKLEDYIKITGVSCVYGNLSIRKEGKTCLSVGYIKQLSAIVRVPVIGAPLADLSTIQIRKAASVGMNALIFDEEVRNSYMAGLRTKLRDREIRDPAVLGGVPLTAVYQTVKEIALAIAPHA